MNFTVIHIAQGAPYYFNCRECGDPLLFDGDFRKTESRRALGFCEACRPADKKKTNRKERRIKEIVIKSKLTRREVLVLLGEL